MVSESEGSGEKVTRLERTVTSMSDDIVVFVTWANLEADVVRMAPGEVLQVAGRVDGDLRELPQEAGP